MSLAQQQERKRVTTVARSTPAEDSRLQEEPVDDLDEAEAETHEPATHVGSSRRAFSDGGSTPPASTIL